jgi:hypothetical protein
MKSFDRFIEEDLPEIPKNFMNISSVQKYIFWHFSTDSFSIIDSLNYENLEKYKSLKFFSTSSETSIYYGICNFSSYYVATWTDFAIACGCGHKDIIKNLYEKTEDPYHFTIIAILMLSKYGFLEILKNFAHREIFSYIPIKYYEKAYLLAFSNGHQSVFEYLEKKHPLEKYDRLFQEMSHENIDLSQMMKYSFSSLIYKLALYNTCISGSVSNFLLLLPFVSIEPFYENILYMVASSGHLSLFKICLQLSYQPLNPYLRESYKSAAFNGHTDIVIWIDSDVYLSEKEYTELFTFMCIHGFLRLAQLFLRKIVITIEEISSHIFIEVCRRGHLEMFQWLISLGTDFTYNNYQGINAVLYYGHFNIVFWIFENQLFIPEIHDNTSVLLQLGRKRYISIILYFVDLGLFSPKKVVNRHYYINDEDYFDIKLQILKRSFTEV